MLTTYRQTGGHNTVLSADVVAVLVVLLPGFLTSHVIARLVVTRPSETWERVPLVLLWALVDYSLLQALSIVFPVLTASPATALQSVADAAALPAAQPTMPLGFLALLTVALAVGVLASLVSRYEWYLHLLRRLRVTRRTARASTWSDAFHRYAGVPVLVQLTNGTTIFGRVRYFSDTPDEGSIVVSHPHLVGEDGTLTEAEIAAAILLTGETPLESVQFDPKFPE